MSKWKHFMDTIITCWTLCNPMKSMKWTFILSNVFGRGFQFACTHSSFMHSFFTSTSEKGISRKICDYQIKRQKKMSFHSFRQSIGESWEAFSFGTFQITNKLHLKVLIKSRTTEALEQTTHPRYHTRLQTRKMIKESDARIERLEKTSQDQQGKWLKWWRCWGHW